MADRTARPTAERTGALSLGSTTLVIVGHGSHRSGRSAEPAYAHADAIRDRDAFADVRTAFWKEEPSPREVLRTVGTDDAVVVPLFMAAGYFTETVLPRELGLVEGPAADVDGTVRYAAPVGSHEALTAVVLERAERLAGDREFDDGVGLAIVGHGTERNANSAAAARAHAARIRDRGRYDEVRALYLDESPSVGDLADHFATDDVVIVPLFVADGRHTRTDVPAAVGLTDDGHGDYDVPAAADGHRVWYAGAVGTDPRIADVICDRALAVARDGRISHCADAASSIGSPDSSSNASPSHATELEARVGHAIPNSRHGRAFLRWIEGADPTTDSATEPVRHRIEIRETGPTRTWGELLIAATVAADGSRTYELRHEADRDATAARLDRLDRPRELRDRVRYDDRGEFRPLRTAPTLPTGWRLAALDGATLVRAVETVYPATIANWYRDRTGDLAATHFRETADRQTGRYEGLGRLDRTDVDAVAAARCTDDSCLKRRSWDYDAADPLAVPRGGGRLPCREPCSLALEAARERATDAVANGVTE